MKNKTRKLVKTKTRGGAQPEAEENLEASSDKKSIIIKNLQEFKKQCKTYNHYIHYHKKPMINDTILDLDKFLFVFNNIPEEKIKSNLNLLVDLYKLFIFIRYIFNKQTFQYERKKDIGLGLDSPEFIDFTLPKYDNEEISYNTVVKIIQELISQ